MVLGAFLHITTDKFQKDDNEDAELVNPNMYGKKLATYIQTALIHSGYKVPFFCCEDWGWWINIAGIPFSLGLCIYGQSDEDGLIHEYAIASSVHEERKWSWSKFRMVNTRESITKLMSDLESIFRSDAEISGVEWSEGFPF